MIPISKPNKKAKGIALSVMSIALLSGCASFDASKARDSQIDDFTNRLEKTSSELLSKPLSLDECIAIAMTNNYNVRKADVDKELARLGRKTAFAAFLPQISAAACYNSFHKEPLTSSKRFDTEEITVGLPIFMPSTWFLYDAAKHGFAEGEIAANYTRQGIALQTTDNYCNILVQQDLIKALEAQLAAATKNAERIKGLADEGLITKWEGQQADYLVQARKVQLNQAKRKMTVLSAKFLSDLGLSPSSSFTLKDIPVKEQAAENTSLTDLVAFALENHPMLSMADRDVVIHEDKVKEAFCNMIPTASIFGNQSWSGNKVMTVSPNLVTGFNAAWDIFSGIAIAKYKASKVELEKVKLERENTFLSIIVNVTEAEASLNDAADAETIKKKAYDVASAKFEDYDAKSREGLIPLGDALDALAERDIAQVELVKSKYQTLCAQKALDFACGKILEDRK